MFALVDVWDALTSDRPYRKAWTAEQARDFIRQQSGTHFDPQIAEVWLALQA
jgi:putative two-component system response regulator